MARRLMKLSIICALIAPNLAMAMQQPEAPEKEEKICRESESRTGSRIRTGRRCRTAEEWRKEDEERARVPLSLTVTEGQNDGHAAQRPQ